MVKWADYLISAVRYNFEHTHIVDVKRHLDQGNSIALGNIVGRIIVVDDLLKGLKYKTIFRGQDSKWKIGEDIRIIPNTGFITTDPNTTTRDNLGGLPEF
jgi:hypothetical protein